ncbi:MAG: hypothetical protein WC707_01000 [Candidatus Babeliaceae bacterium]
MKLYNIAIYAFIISCTIKPVENNDALHKAVRHKSTKQVKKLLADPTINILKRDKNNKTALNIASEIKHYPSIRLIRKTLQRQAKKSENRCPVCWEDFKTIPVKKLWVMQKCCNQVLCSRCYNIIKTTQKKCTFCVSEL